MISPVRFGFEADEETTFAAAGVAGYWNGWLVPVVDRATLTAVIAWMNERDEERRTELVGLRDGAVSVVEFEAGDGGGECVSEMRLTQDPDGNYRMDLGLTLVAVQ